jgi:hypothetical protein
MTTVINPDIRVRVETIFDDVWDSAEEETRLDIDIEVTKDLTGEPNQAIVRLYNLNDDTVNILAAGGDPSIELFFNRYGDTELVSCFLGEIVNCYTTQEHPGSVTNLICESQRAHSRDKYIKLNYEAGTAVTLIIDAMVNEIGLPVQSVSIPSGFSIEYAMTLTGPAFLNLREFLSQEALGMFCYIVDGVLYISSVFEPPIPTVVELKNSFLTEQPQPTTRRDVRDIWYTSSLNNPEAAAAAAANSFTINSDKVKKISKRMAMDKNKKIVQVDAVDTDIKGRAIRMLGLPDLQPDTVVNIEGDTSYYRIQRLTHRGDNHEGIITDIQADAFEGH